MTDTDDTISAIDDAIVEDGIEEDNPAEQAALAVMAFYDTLSSLVSPGQIRHNAIDLTIAWIRAGMPGMK